MSIKSILLAEHRQLLLRLSNQAAIYNYQHISLSPYDLRSIIDDIEEIEKELLSST